MNLADFTLDETLNHLRKKMGADKLGRFELFNPDLHLSWEQRQLLARQWVNIEGNILHTGTENLLYFKNSPVITKVDGVFHFALCDEIKKKITQGKLAKAEATTCIELLNNAQNCTYCLHAVSYQGFDAYRHRHQQYNEKILKDFNLIRFINAKASIFKS
jgi:hypothetical protein